MAGTASTKNHAGDEASNFSLQAAASIQRSCRRALRAAGMRRAQKGNSRLNMMRSVVRMVRGGMRMRIFPLFVNRLG